MTERVGAITPEQWQRAKEVFGGALELAPDERAAFVAAACGTDTALRREVESLLAALDGATTFLTAPSGGKSARRTPAPSGLALAARLAAALDSRYAIEREVGRGGAATVFLARDVRHQRRVAIKVLHPDLASALGAERFVREIETAARLAHPHILPLFDSGDAEGLLWYAMPFVEGESLRDRLRREGRLRVEEVVRIVGEVAEALDYAHRRGFVHRDVKPENVLLADGHAVVADFGVAKALAAATTDAPETGDAAPKGVGTSGVGTGSADTLTAAGLVVGTPAYMAPEQALGDSRADHRADLYALGCVAYEMLAGRPPFTDRMPRALLAAHVLEPPVPVSVRRADAPPPLAAIVMRCLEKRSEDRPHSAAEVVDALRGVTPASTARGTVPRARDARSLPRVARLALAGLALVSALALAAITVGRHGSPSSPATPNAGVVAVLPFRVAGASPLLGYLREGMVDLLAPALAGGSVRAADSRTVLVAWRREGQGDLPPPRAAALAARLGAGRVLEGEVVGTPERLVLHATLYAAPAVGAARAQVTVTGPADSLPALVGRLAGGILAAEAGEGEPHLFRLASTPLPALRAYLSGRALARQGRYTDALAQFDTALQDDSTFALAGLGYVEVARFGGYNNRVDRGGRVAWRYRDRLPPLDRMYLDVLGIGYPLPPSYAEQITAAERYANRAPESAAAWSWLGELLFAYGALTSTPDALTRARRASAGAAALDSTFMPAVEHRPQLYGAMGDTAGLRALARRLASSDAASETAVAQRWYVASLLGDEATLRTLRPRLATMKRTGQLQLVIDALATGVNLPDAERVVAAAGSRALTQDDQRAVAFMRRFLWLDRGHPSAWARADDSLAANAWWCDACMRALDAVLWDGDSAAGAAAARALAPSLAGPPAPDASARGKQAWRWLAVAQYDLARGDARAARRALALLRAPAPARDTSGQGAWCVRFATLLDAQVAAVDRRADASAALQRLDSLLTRAPAGSTFFLGSANLVAARLWAAQGDPARALTAVRRQVRGNLQPFHATYVREEGRLAALVGDYESARRAYGLYLRLRADPEPLLRAEVARAGGELAAVGRERAGR